MIPEVDGQGLLIGPNRNQIEARNPILKTWRDYEVCKDAHNWSPLKSPNATTLPSVSSPRDPAPSRAFPLNRFGGNGHIANVDGSHNQIQIRARENGWSCMVERGAP